VPTRTCEDCGKKHARRSARCAECAGLRREEQKKKWKEANPNYHTEYVRDWRKKNPEQNRAIGRSEAAKARRREWWLSDEGRAKGRDYARKRYAQSDQRKKRRARNAVATEVRAGRLIPPDLCEDCGETPGQGSDGRRLIRADHYLGYDEPHWLSVRWICVHCDGKKERVGGKA